MPFDISFSFQDVVEMIKTVGPWLSALIVGAAVVLTVTLPIAFKRLTSSAQITKPVTTSNDIKVENSVGVSISPVTATQQDTTTGGDSNFTGGNQTIINVQNIYNPVRDDNIAATKETREIPGTDGNTNTADVWVIWRDASWHNGLYTFNEGKLREFFKSPDYQKAIREAGAIACLGLVSSWMDDDLRVSPDRDSELWRMSDRRARILCGQIADETRGLDRQPLLFGLGLGFNEIKAEDRTSDQKQRALILIHVRSNSGRVITKPEVEAAIRLIIREGNLNDFNPSEYSEVQSGKILCWFSVEEGLIPLSNRDCPR